MRRLVRRVRAYRAARDARALDAYETRLVARYGAQFTPTRSAVTTRRTR